MSGNNDLKYLAHRYADGIATADEVRVVNATLRDDAVFRAWFIDFMNLDAALEAHTAMGDSLTEPGDDVIIRAASMNNYEGRATTVKRRLLAAAVCASLILGVLSIGLPSASQGLATVQSVAGDAGLPAHTVLTTDNYVVKEGTLELLTTLGTRIVVEAPATFRFESCQRMHLTRGRMTAEVPPKSKGFTVVTPSGQVVDLGTKFGVDVPEDGQSEVHVFQGEVIAQSTENGPVRNLTDGQAYRLRAGAGRRRYLRSAAFIGPDEVASLHAALAAGQRKASDIAVEKVRQDPALIAILDFESQYRPEGQYHMVQGRWPGTHAPEFVAPDHHMKIEVGGDRSWPELSLAAWVRIDRLNAPYQSLLHTNAWSSEGQGQVHWMINHDTTMRLAMYGNELAEGSDEQHGYPDSRTPVLPEQGRWVHLASVYDSARKTVRFFLNGQFDKETRLRTGHPARLGPAQIGNWEQEDRKLSGRVDELLILGRAMSDDEICDLFEAGNPYR